MKEYARNEARNDQQGGQSVSPAKRPLDGADVGEAGRLRPSVPGQSERQAESKEGQTIELLRPVDFDRSSPAAEGVGRARTDGKQRSVRQSSSVPSSSQSEERIGAAQKHAVGEPPLQMKQKLRNDWPLWQILHAVK